MNLTRWVIRLPGTQRRNAATAEPGASQPGRGPGDEPGGVPAARSEHRDPASHGPKNGPKSGPGGAQTGGPGIDALALHDLLGQVPTPVAVVRGPDHRVAYVNGAYAALFGTRVPGRPARDCLTELVDIGLLPLLDQVQRSGTPRTLKTRSVPGDTRDTYFTFTCTPVRVAATADDPAQRGVLVLATDVTDQVVAAERLRESESQQRAAAVTLQRSLLPQRLEQPDDLRVAATYQPGGIDAAVGGDWYDVITLGAGRTAVVIGDVMGRGVRAAAVMGQLRTAVRAYARLDLPPHEVLQLLDGLAAEIDASQIATCVYAVYDPNEGTLTYASAGHLPLFIREPDATVRRVSDPTGPPLGTGGWLHTSGAVPFGPGSSVVLYTDGLVERRDADIDEGIDKLERALAGAGDSPQIVCDRLLRALAISEDHDDDVAILVLACPERHGEEADLFRGAALDLLGGIEAAPRARAFADGVLASWRFPEELRELGVLAASELVANSLKHGRAPMGLRLRRTDRRLIVEVTDGDEHLPRRQQAEPADETGRGIAVVATIAAEWGARRLPEGGKAVWAEFALPGSS
ncbi:ATP-binding SpoIIE family protein phosphatase [Streptomyces specialis]|uniref:ATP-binding SpoIIE family protein phosphatase n=1 Tax=Streptomyces specialis TaxID=498367 RepID=UPI00073F4232|nr:SpoIIE family protein phosphatase [Streptomyces specialis]